MAVNMFERPIPGQSLTSEPKNRPYETPPEISDPEEALMLHLKRLDDVERMDSIMILLQKGVDVATLTEGLLRSAVMEGIHSIDVSLTIAPTVHKFISDTAKALEIDFKTGFEPDEQEEDRKEKTLVTKMLKDIGYIEGEAPSSDVEPEAAPMEEDQQMEMDLGEAEQAPSKGLMSRV